PCCSTSPTTTPSGHTASSAIAWAPIPVKTPCSTRRRTSCSAWACGARAAGPFSSPGCAASPRPRRAMSPRRIPPAPGSSWPREKDHEYDVDHGGDFFYIRTNGGGRRNFRLVRTPVADPRPERWEELIPHRENVMLEEFDVFVGHHVVHEREDGLIRLRVTGL